MRYFAVLVLNIVLVAIVQGQSIADKVAANACEYLGGIDDLETLQDSIQASLSMGMAKIMTEGTPEDRKQIGSVEGIRSALKQAYDLLPSYCTNVRRLMIEGKKAEFYKKSASQAANDDFDKGNSLMEAGKYGEAIKVFRSAIKIDNNFVLAIDHAAICYRKKGDYKPAIKYYKKSLGIFPEGDIALLNIAVCYSFLKESQNAIDSYEQFKWLYPDSPEGYFGLAKMLFMVENYESALDNAFIAHRIYLNTNSEYLKDSQQLISIMHAKLNELNKVDLMEQKAAEHNIQIER